MESSRLVTLDSLANGHLMMIWRLMLWLFGIGRRRSFSALRAIQTLSIYGHSAVYCMRYTLADHSLRPKTSLISSRECRWRLVRPQTVIGMSSRGFRWSIGSVSGIRTHSSNRRLQRRNGCGRLKKSAISSCVIFSAISFVGIICRGHWPAMQHSVPFFLQIQVHALHQSFHSSPGALEKSILVKHPSCWRWMKDPAITTIQTKRAVTKLTAAERLISH